MDPSNSGISGSLSQSGLLSKTLSWLVILLILAGSCAYYAGVS